MKFMNKLKEKKNELKKNNKGFSLVELIIVIAIMAILVGIVGTQVLPYIDKSRNAKDIQVLSGLNTDALTAYSSNAANLDAKATYVITIDSTKTDVEVKGGTDAENKILKDAFQELNSVKTVTDLKLESKAGKVVTKVEITCQNTKPMTELKTTLSDTTITNFTNIQSK